MAISLSKITKLSQALDYASAGYKDAKVVCPSAASWYEDAYKRILALANISYTSMSMTNTVSSNVDSDPVYVATAKLLLTGANSTCSKNKVAALKTTKTPPAGTDSAVQNDLPAPPAASDYTWLYYVLGGLVVGGGSYYVYRTYAKKAPKRLKE